MPQLARLSLTLLLSAGLLQGCTYTSCEDLARKRAEESSYVVCWKNKENGFVSKMKGVFDKESAEDLAARKQQQKPENEYWIELVRLNSNGN